jgi:hypothetical protein
VKARILLEMAADLEALYEHYRARGYADDEAARLTEERILASPEALQHLIMVHTTGYQRWLSRAAGQLRWGFELLLVVLGVLPMVAISTVMVAAQVRGMISVPFLWPLLILGAVLTVLALWKAFQLFVARVRSTVVLHRGLPTLLLLAVIGPAFGGVAFLIHLYGISMTVAASSADPDVVFAAAEPLAQSATFLGMGLLLGLAAALVWFVLVNRIAAIEQVESAALLAG